MQQPIGQRSMRQKKSWREKLADGKGLPKVGRIEGKMTNRWGKDTMVIPAPMEVDALMKYVPKGKLVTINELRTALAKKTQSRHRLPDDNWHFCLDCRACSRRSGRRREEEITPYWRTLKTGGELNAKYPGGVEKLRLLLEQEGHKIIQKGKRALVSEYENWGSLSS